MTAPTLAAFRTVMGWRLTRSGQFTDYFLLPVSGRVTVAEVGPQGVRRANFPNTDKALERVQADMDRLDNDGWRVTVDLAAFPVEGEAINRAIPNTPEGAEALYALGVLLVRAAKARGDVV